MKKITACLVKSLGRPVEAIAVLSASASPAAIRSNRSTPAGRGSVLAMRTREGTCKSSMATLMPSPLPTLIRLEGRYEHVAPSLSGRQAW